MGCENVDIFHQFYLKFCKSLLDVKQTTPSVMVYGEVGTTPLHLKIKSRVLSFWYKIVSGSKDRICYKLYQLMHYLHENDLFHSKWKKKTVHNTLNTLGLSDIWLSRDTFYSQAAFKNKVKTSTRGDSPVLKHFYYIYKFHIIKLSCKCVQSVIHGGCSSVYIAYVMTLASY